MQINRSLYTLSPNTGFPTTPKQDRDPIQEFRYFEQERKNNAQQPWYYDTAEQTSTSPVEATSERQVNRDNWEIERINGYDVVVAGHKLDSQDGFGLSWDVPPEMQSANYWREAEANATYVEAEFSAGTPYQGSGRIHSIGDSIESVPLAQNKSQSLLQQVRQALERIDLLKVENSLQNRYGEDVKLAYDYDSKAYLMLKPGDGRYDEVNTGADYVKSLREGIAGGHVPQDVVTLYRKAGYI